jgi:hypothetical protein
MGKKVLIRSPMYCHSKHGICKKCYGNEKLTQSRAIENFKSFHGNKYDYSKVEYKNAHSKITIVCPEHGEFKQTPNNHKNGNGCPACCESTGEVQIRTFLENKCVKYMSQHKFLDCKNILSLPFDFYLPEYNLCIEYNGMQHYKPIEYFGGNIGFKKRKINDKIKVKYCKDHNISLLIIKYNENVNKKLQIDFLNLSIKNLDFASSWPFMSGFSNTFIYGVKIAKKIKDLGINFTENDPGYFFLNIIP